jgi:hypothetical protein
VIETSQNKDDLLPWGTDECVLWNTQVSPLSNGFSGGPRGTAWAPGDFNPQTCKYDNQKVWVGWLDAPGARDHGPLRRRHRRPGRDHPARQLVAGRATSRPTAPPPTASATSGPSASTAS